MNPELTYFIKVNVAIALFYAFYRLFFYKDTFFYWRRTVLLCFFVVSLLYPFLNIQNWIKEHEPMVAMADLYTAIVLPEQTVYATQNIPINWQELICQILIYAYWSGVFILVIRFLIQLGSIIRLHISCSKKSLLGTDVHILNKKAGPFSFFHWIFLYPTSHTESEISEIITHEATHARQYHSVDVIISELMCILCWFNPFVWLMKREVRGNLEYMADHKVLETGHDSKSYQYHLLGLAHHKAAANISNSFNVLPLKNRIKMMNKRRTKEIGRTKYFMFLPLAALLMIISNIEMVARTTKEFAKEIMKQTTAEMGSQLETATFTQLPTHTDVATMQDKKVTQSKNKVAPPPPPMEKKGDQSEPIFQQTDEMPSFPGGQQAFMNYLNNNIKYPAIAHENGIQGRVIVQFVVKKDGSITDTKIARGVNPYLDKEALRVISTMPKWEPGKQNGKTVNVQYTVPVMFKLSDPEPPKAEEIKDSELSEIIVTGYGSNENSDNESPLQMAEQMPRFPGGQEALMQYLAKTIKYPVMAQQKKEQGRVIVKMVIGNDGSISDVSIVKGISSYLNAEAIRVVNNMPKWEPGMQKGQKVSVYYTLPIVFRLQ